MRPSLVFVSLAVADAAAMVQLRVCTLGGQGKCSNGAGQESLETLRFLSPKDGPELTGCSCLARCDTGVAVQQRSDDMEASTIYDEINSPRQCAALLRQLGYSVDPRLPDAFATARKADELAASGNTAKALGEYTRALQTAANAGLGLRWASRPSSVVRARESALAAGSDAPPVNDDVEGGAVGAAPAARTGGAQPATAGQTIWLVRTHISRSRLCAESATSRGGKGWERLTRQALEDARYAVQLAESSVVEMSRVEGRGAPAAFSSAGILAGSANEALTDAWERQAEAYELVRDIDGAIYAYDRLLKLEPSSTPGLSAAVAAKRGVQELVLLSHRKGLEDTAIVSRGLQEVGEERVRSVTSRAITDVENLRRVVEKEFDAVEGALEKRAAQMGVEVVRGEGEAAGQGAGRAQPGEKLGPLASLAARSVDDLRILRKLARSDLNFLELNLLRGDPLLAFLRDAVSKISGNDLFPASGAPPALAALPEDSVNAIWLREQFEKGALPRDPFLISGLVGRAKTDPQLVKRLVSEAKDAKGEDVFTRAATVDEPAS